MSVEKTSQCRHQQTLYGTFVYCQLYWKDKNKEKEAGNGLFLEQKIKFKTFSAQSLDDVFRLIKESFWNGELKKARVFEQV